MTHAHALSREGPSFNTAASSCKLYAACGLPARSAFAPRPGHEYIDRHVRHGIGEQEEIAR